MNFWAKAINDAEKAVNPAHVIALSLTAAVIVWGFWEMYHSGGMPSGDHLKGAAELLGGAGAVNVAHKAEDIISRFKKPADTPAPADPQQP
jgi:hypothetical protein